MDGNTYYGNKQGNPNMYYGTNQMEQRQEFGYNYNNQNHGNTDNYQYPTTGLTIGDAEVSNSRTEFVLPENVKLGMILSAVFCILCFFVVLLVK